MNKVLVVDSCSIFDFRKFYRFDKYDGSNVYSKLTDFLFLKIKSGEIRVIDKVFNEIKGYKAINFKRRIEPSVVDTLFLFEKVQELLENNIRESIIQMKKYTPEQVEHIKVEYEKKIADLYLVAYCDYLKRNGNHPILVTEEWFREDFKIVEKIPAICKKEKIEFQNMPYSLFDIYKDELKFKLDIKSNYS